MLYPVKTEEVCDLSSIFNDPGANDSVSWQHHVQKILLCHQPFELLILLVSIKHSKNLRRIWFLHFSDLTLDLDVCSCWQFELVRKLFSSCTLWQLRVFTIDQLVGVEISVVEVHTWEISRHRSESREIAHIKACFSRAVKHFLDQELSKLLFSQ